MRAQRAGTQPLRSASSVTCKAFDCCDGPSKHSPGMQHIGPQDRRKCPASLHGHCPGSGSLQSAVSSTSQARIRSCWTMDDECHDRHFSRDHLLSFKRRLTRDLCLSRRLYTSRTPGGSLTRRHNRCGNRHQHYLKVDGTLIRTVKQVV